MSWIWGLSVMEILKSFAIMGIILRATNIGKPISNFLKTDYCIKCSANFNFSSFRHFWSLFLFITMM